ncbi:hypothetical protein PF010_g12088 [Phytophthora fragariae]|uniref:Secreted protein n=1 Tax=Phytophthora fragariae TaxID=53985 RepID=A0A6G0L428_9STRA|nr:hypothetical protein PF010_g12088 [Phytophthora fragariae]
MVILPLVTLSLTNRACLANCGNVWLLPLLLITAMALWLSQYSVPTCGSPLNNSFSNRCVYVTRFVHCSAAISSE